LSSNYEGKHASGRAEAQSKVSTGAASSGGGAGEFIKSFIIDVIIAVILAAIVLFFIRPTIVRQTSMENTLHDGDYMIMYKQAYRSHTPQRGDIVIFQSSLINEDTGGGKLLIKRVIGLPGDKIRIDNDQLYINDEIYEEDYLKDGYTPAGGIAAEGETITVPEGHYFCMGDNRAGSVDSRDPSVGYVDFDQIKGRVVLRLFPFNKIQRF
jgi:signal peptidase I